MQEPKITPYSVSEGKVKAIKVEDSIGNEIIETEPFSIENIPVVAQAIISFANRRRQLEVFRRTYEEGQALFAEAETNLKQAIQQANKGLTSAGFFELGDKEPAGRDFQRHVNSPAPAEREQPIPQVHEDSCGCSECAEKHWQEFEQQIKEEKSQEPEVKAGTETVQPEKKEETAVEEATKQKPLIKIPEPQAEKTAEQWSEEIYEKLMQDLHTNFKGKTLKREEITQKLTSEYAVPEALAQEVVSIIHERARKEKKISEPKGEGIFGSIAKRLRKAK